MTRSCWSFSNFSSNSQSIIPSIELLLLWWLSSSSSIFNMDNCASASEQHFFPLIITRDSSWWCSSSSSSLWWGIIADRLRTRGRAIVGLKDNDSPPLCVSFSVTVTGVDSRLSSFGGRPLWDRNDEILGGFGFDDAGSFSFPLIIGGASNSRGGLSTDSNSDLNFSSVSNSPFTFASVFLVEI